MADKTYELTFELSNGTTKTVNFTAPQGPKGDTGATGPQGLQGEKGDTGARGIYYGPAVDSSGNLSWTPSQSIVDGLPVPIPSAVNIKGPKGDTGDTGATGATGSRGTGIYHVTTAPSSYTTATGGFTPTYRIALSTVKSQAGVNEVLVGDNLRYSYYLYPVGYVDSSYVYLGARTSIRGATGAQGATGATGPQGETGPQGPQGPAGEDAEGAIPDYVRTEAERVAAVVQSHQNANTLTFIAASDFHYSTVVSTAAQQKESMTHMGQAMGLIRKLAHIDFTIALGDMVWDSGETIDQAMAAMRFVSECLYAGHNGTAHLRTRGNHECLYSHDTGLTDAQIFANVGAWNSGATYDADNRLSGYCYRDFEDVKIRVICLNSSEVNTGGCLLTSAQVTWLASALDLSEKGSDWRSIVASHHPLDWGKDGGTSPITTINNATGLLCAIHGHLHNFKVDTISGTSVKRIAVPNACFGRENEYTTAYNITWGESTTYGKTAGTAEDTAFVVLTIDREAGKVYADHYGAGYDREITIEGSGSSYTNLVPTSIDSSGAVYNGTGYKQGYRLNSSGTETALSTATCTGFMRCSYGDVIRVFGLCDSTAGNTGNYIAFYDSSFTKVGVTGGQYADTYGSWEASGNGYLWTFDTSKFSVTGFAYIRVSLEGIVAGEEESLIVTVNEEIE